MPEAIPPEGASWNQEGSFYGQEAQTTRDCGKPYVSDALVLLVRQHLTGYSRLWGSIR